MACVQDDQGLWSEPQSVVCEVAVTTDASPEPALYLTGRGDIPAYTPATGLVGGEGFRYIGMKSPEITVVANTMIVMMVEVNDRPSANDDVVAVASQSPAQVIDVLTNDLDMDGDPLAVIITDPPQHGTVRIEKGRIVYTPEPGYTGEDRFEYAASDGSGFDKATVQVFVSDVPIVPTVERFTCAPGVILSGGTITLTAEDVIDPDGQVVQAAFYRDANGNGTLEPGIDVLLGVDDNGTNGWTWTGPTGRWLGGNIVFLVRVQDNQGLWSEVRVTICEIRSPNRSSVGFTLCLLICASALARYTLAKHRRNSRDKQAVGPRIYIGY